MDIIIIINLNTAVTAGTRNRSLVGSTSPRDVLVVRACHIFIQQNPTAAARWPCVGSM